MSLVLPWTSRRPPYVGHDWRHDQARGLVAWWPLTALEPGASNVRWLDAAGLSPDHTAGYWSLQSGTATGFLRMGSPAYDSLLGPCMYFAGSNQWLRTNNPSLNLTTFTLAAWVRPNFTNGTGSQANAQILGHPLSDTSAVDPYLYYNIGTDSSSPAKFVTRISTGIAGSLTSVTGTTSIALGTPYHVAATYDGTALRLYVNGIQDGSSSPSITVGSGSTYTYMGSFLNNLGGTDWWLGHIGDTRIYNRALSATEVWQLFAPQTRWGLYTPALGLDPAAALMTPDAAGGAHRFFFAS